MWTSKWKHLSIYECWSQRVDSPLFLAAFSRTTENIKEKITDITEKTFSKKKFLLSSKPVNDMHIKLKYETYLEYFNYKASYLDGGIAIEITF